MALFGNELMVASPLGEGEHGLGKNRVLQEQRDQQRADFGNRQGDQACEAFFRREAVRA